ncbi:MAG: DegT/DnrJ/EryC1/StrS family aminotransferase [Thermodesulfobacteria bacterium]|nr:DegT/DnrJ/EryC1/StrS family aminotransferase [Thermodesulfobacteriota bacterium]
MIKFKIPFHRPYISQEEIEEVTKVIKSGWLTMGPKTLEFEEKFKEYIYSDSEKKGFAISLNSCTAALHLALKAAGIKPGDEVIIPTNTFIATAEAVTYLGAKPVLCDVEYETHNMDVSLLESLITEKTKAIIPVHFGGQPCDMDEILKIAKKYGLYVIEDAAHALPSWYKGKKIGTIGHLTCFSFYATKTLATGEGGMITTFNEEFAKSIKINRLHGIDRDAWNRYTLQGDWYYEVVEQGYKYNTTDLQSALGIAQLNKLEWMWKRRKEIAQKYEEAFKHTSIETLKIKSDRETSWHLYVIKVNNRDELYKKLKEKGIGTSVHFIPVHRHPYYKNKFNYKKEDYSVAEEVFKRCLSLPIYPGLNEEEVEYIVENVVKYAR